MNSSNSYKIWILLLMISIPLLFSFSSNRCSSNNHHLQQILDDLWIAKGDFRFKKPIIQLSEAGIGKAAYFIPSTSNPTIELEEKAYNICQKSSNPNATLSIIIGHELAHYFQNPILIEGEQCSYASNAFNAFADNVSAKKAKEIEADYKGIFNAYLANYEVKKYSREILDLLYTGYNFEQGNEYAPLAERKRVAEEVLKKADTLIALYEAGNHFYAIGNYALAIASYKRILIDYQAKEIYNNLGVAYALESLRYAENNELKFIYPIEIDVRSKLKQTQGYGDKNFAEIRKMLLSNAFANFEIALQLDPKYSSAKLNKACALSMKGYADPNEPAHIHHLREVKEWHFYQEAILLEGIRAGLDGETTIAESKFKEVIASNREAGTTKMIAQANLNILKGNKGNINVCEDFYNYDVPKLVGELANEQTFPSLNIYNNHTCTVKYKEDKYGTILIVGEGKILTNNLYATINITNNTQPAFSDIIRVGTNLAKLEEFQCNRRLAKTNDGYFQLFDDIEENSFLFKIDDHTRLISKWGIVSSNLK